MEDVPVASQRKPRPVVPEPGEQLQADADESEVSAPGQERRRAVAAPGMLPIMIARLLRPCSPG